MIDNRPGRLLSWCRETLKQQDKPPYRGPIETLNLLSEALMETEDPSEQPEGYMINRHRFLLLLERIEKLEEITGDLK